MSYSRLSMVMAVRTIRSKIANHTPSRQLRCTINRIIRKKHIVFYLLFRCFSRTISGCYYLAAIYSYMRYLDDLVDEPTVSADEAMWILEEQREKILCLYDRRHIIPKTDYDVLLLQFVEYDLQNGSSLKNPLLAMLGSLFFDSNRIGRIMSHAELEEYSETMGSSFLSFMFHFLHKAPSNEGQLKAVARAACQAYMLRDLREDLKKGYINVDEESIKLFEIDIRDPESNNFRDWIKERVQQLERQLKAFTRILREEQCFRNRLILLLFLEPRRHVLRRIRGNQFVPFTN